MYYLVYLVVKPWEARDEDPDLLKFVKQRRVDLHYLKHEKPEREKKQFIGGASE